MSEDSYLFTSESVSMGHPDKLADRISDGILDALFEQDPHSRVACETMVTTGFVAIAGEITTAADIDYEAVVRNVIREVGYTDEELGFNADTCEFVQKIDTQSADIAQGVDEGFRCRQRRGCWRSGADVWFCLQGYPGTDASADCALAPDTGTD